MARAKIKDMSKILVVDDDKDILDILQYILEDYGYEVDTLSDGRYFFDQISEHKPDLILLDVMLGNMDGRDLCKAVKTQDDTQRIPVIMLSASHHSTDADGLGAPDDFIEKPFDIPVLINHIQRQLAA